MKKVTYIKTSWCPYCHKADKMLADLKANVERYRDVEIEIIDEDQNPQEAARYDYRLVPNFWVDGKKVLEGVPRIETVRTVLDLATARLDQSAPGQEKSGEEKAEDDVDAAGC